MAREMRHPIFYSVIRRAGIRSIRLPMFSYCGGWDQAFRTTGESTFPKRRWRQKRAGAEPVADTGEFAGGNPRQGDFAKPDYENKASVRRNSPPQQRNIAAMVPSSGSRIYFSPVSEGCYTILTGIIVHPVADQPKD